MDARMKRDLAAIEHAAQITMDEMGALRLIRRARTMADALKLFEHWTRLREREATDNYAASYSED